MTDAECEAIEQKCVEQVRKALKTLTSGEIYNEKGYLNKRGYDALEEIEGLDLFWICDPLIKLAKAIDNAPRVEINDKTLEIARKSIELGRRVGKLEGKLERSQGEWIPVSERLPDEKYFNPTGSDFGFDFEEVLCTTIWGDVRAYKFGTPIGHDKPHFWLGGGIMDEYVIAWQPLPEPYTEKKYTNFYTKRFNEVN